MTEVKFPWNRPELEGWLIKKMNHFLANGNRTLDVEMAKGDMVISSFGKNEEKIFDELAIKAKKLESMMPKNSNKELEQFFYESAERISRSFFFDQLKITEQEWTAAEETAKVVYEDWYGPTNWNGEKPSILLSRCALIGIKLAKDGYV